MRRSGDYSRLIIRRDADLSKMEIRPAARRLWRTGFYQLLPSKFLLSLEGPVIVRNFT